MHTSNGSDISDRIVILLVHLLAAPFIAVLKLGDEPALEGSSRTKHGADGNPNKGELPPLHKRPDETNSEHGDDDDELARDDGHELASGL